MPTRNFSFRMQRRKTGGRISHRHKELFFQNEEKEKRAPELVIATKNFSSERREEKSGRGSSHMPHKELLLQNEEKEERRQSGPSPTRNFSFRTTRKEKRAAELVIATEKCSRRRRATWTAELVMRQRTSPAEEERRRTTEAIRDSEERFRMVFETRI